MRRKRGDQQRRHRRRTGQKHQQRRKRSQQSQRQCPKHLQRQRKSRCLKNRSRWHQRRPRSWSERQSQRRKEPAWCRYRQQPEHHQPGECSRQAGWWRQAQWRCRSGPGLVRERTRCSGRRWSSRRRPESNMLAGCTYSAEYVRVGASPRLTRNVTSRGFESVTRETCASPATRGFD